ncbi:Vitamin B12 dependent methionine synthase activation subunit [Desulfofundulus thermobenzoicus]|uniref:Vitamin B12 dependent methionine synthase activation subunit n=1 Tax=Desulfofundulus thermobenzoicus TaxID=29376 RepID=A0A6N7IRL2_9FIRM|nr:Vitamin B12 dependent methionine synthase activation subunit [Desulfofundulus thermobenzoicus]MQL52704.1 Vitamin B12 dependent methionine synthase activation subunit [Desulfofundulus thermobenzoicus]HHW44717.1 Vitamin B12 dependent methionine synthase activation subunit [Desulfotomaculum sp.]
MNGSIDYYDLHVDITVKDIYRAEGASYRQAPPPATRELHLKMLQEARQLVRPRGVSRTVAVEGADGRQIRLAGGGTLTSRLLARLAGSAESLVLIICTLGEELDRRVQEYTRQGRPAEAYVLDAAGTAFIDAAGRLLAGRIGEQFHARDLQTTIPLGPGHSYWPDLQDQRVIYDLLQPQAMGVRILESGLMLPKKTVSLVMGVGRSLPESADNHCHYCSLKRSCPLSRAGPGQPG